MNPDPKFPKFEKLLNEISLNFSSDEDDVPFEKDANDIYSDRKLHADHYEQQSDDDEQSFEDAAQKPLKLEAIVATFSSALHMSNGEGLSSVFEKEVDTLSNMLHDMNIVRIEMTGIGSEHGYQDEQEADEDYEEHETSEDDEVHNIYFDAFFQDDEVKHYVASFIINNLTDETSIELDTTSE